MLDQNRRVRDQNVSSTPKLPSPRGIWSTCSLSAAAEENILDSRDQIWNILTGLDQRLLVIVGPCSIHNSESALRYAKHIIRWNDRFGDKFCMVMRAYFAKPRTKLGWSGLVYDPFLNGNGDLSVGLLEVWKLSVELATLGVPAATEALDSITTQYFSHAMSWVAIGARAAEASPLRYLASAESPVVGIKNPTSGWALPAIEGIVAIRHPHIFPGINADGQAASIESNGNRRVHLVLRGGRSEDPGKPSRKNYRRRDLARVDEYLAQEGVDDTGYVIDCSHANAGGNYLNQIMVAKNVVEQRREGNRRIAGIMIESNHMPGKQSIPTDLTGFNASALDPDTSVTDACLGLDDTESLLAHLYRRHKLTA